MDTLRIPAFSAKWLTRQIHHFGLKPEELFGGTDLDIQWLEDPDSDISLDDYSSLVLTAIEKTGEPALGLKVGQWHNLLEFGIWGYAVLSCNTLGEALRVSGKYWELGGPLVNVQTEITDEIIRWTVTPVVEFKDPRLLIFSIEELLSTWLKTTRTLRGEGLSDTVLKMHLVYPAPDHADLYEKVIGCKPEFGKNETIFETESGALALSTSTGNPTMKKMSEQQCRELLGEHVRQDPFIEKIRNMILDSRGRFPMAREVAECLNMSPRSLFRQLKQKGTSYITILNTVREELAVEYLKKTNLSIEQISDLIGFSESTTFRKNFKKWTGSSPSAFRKKHIPKAVF